MTTLSSIRNAAIEDAGAGGLTVYATKEDLPASGLTAGDQAYVSASSRLYVSNGSGWYNIALINATPSLSIDPTGTIVLAIDGSTTTITLTATDSDNAVAGLTYSVESDGSFAGLGTISQDSSVFTITPLSEDSATTASAVLTFKASDGINFGSGDTTLTLSFKVQYSNYTTLLAKADTTGTDNQVDASSNSHTITEYGNVTSTALSPYHPGGYSTYFDGSGDNITISDLAMGSGDCTFEFWMYQNVAQSAAYRCVLAASTYGSGTPFTLYTYGSNVTPWLSSSGGPHISGAFTAYTWHHIALVRNSGTWTLYIDGTSAGTSTTGGSYDFAATTDWRFGENHSGSYDWQGYIKDARFVNGTAVYTSNFTPPAEPLTAIANTSLLTCHAPYIADGSTNGHAITIAGNTSAKRFGPFDYLGYTKADHVGSVYFDGNGDYLTIPDDASLELGSNSFTIEGWVYPNDITSTQNIYCCSTNGSGYAGVRLDINGGQFELTIGTGAGTWTILFQDVGAVSKETWNHFALVRNGNTDVKFYINGANTYTSTAVGSLSLVEGTTVNTISLGRFGNDTLYYDGYISDLRVVNGTAVYTSNFTPPTAPLTAITNTQLLTCTNKNDIWDAGSGSLLAKGGDATSSNTQRKFTTSSAMYFDGSGDSILVNNGDEIADFKSGDFTIEFWFYMVDTGVNTAIGWRSAGGAASTNWVIMYVGGLRFSASDGSSYIVLNLGDAALSSGQWYHTAVTRNGNTFTMWIDGSSVATATSSSAIASTSRPLYIGYDPDTNANAMNGYIQDVRITKGLARYTANFTPPTTEFDG